MPLAFSAPAQVHPLVSLFVEAACSCHFSGGQFPRGSGTSPPMSALDAASASSLVLGLHLT